MTKDIEVIKDIECDECHKKMEFDTIELLFGYKSKFDGLIYDFCGDKCLKTWINKNIKEEEVI